MRPLLRRFPNLSPALAALLLLALPVHAQYTSDIDIYSGAPTSNDLPNVLVMVDNTANWNQVFEIEKGALKSTFTSLPVDRFRVGLSMFAQGSETDGAFVWSAIRTLDSNYQPKLGALVQSLVNEPANKNGHKGNNPAVGQGMAEAYYYFAGKAPRTSRVAAKTDYAGNPNGNAQEVAVHALPGNALASRTAATYNNAFAVGNCAPGYVIYLSNGPASNNDDGPAKQLLDAAYTDTGLPKPAVQQIPISPNGKQSNWGDEWARFMKTAQGITTYTIDVRPKASGQSDAWTAVLKSMAAASGGEYFLVQTDSEEDVGASIQKALADIFNQIQAVNSVFASASLPVSVNARGTYLNQVFMGMFRPDGDGKPRWRGNLKQFKFGYDPTTDTINLVDAQGRAAISGATGFISPTATSYWSHDSSFWANQQMGTPPSPTDAPDGEVVEKGGIAQGIREANATSQAGRKLFTCLACAANTNLATESATQLATASTGLTAAMLNVTAGERDNLIEWVRGADNAGGEAGPGGGVTVRPGVHGDVLHSRPAVVNYGGSTGVVVFYGANDGFLRAVNGNQSGTGAGQELWGFMPEEHLDTLKRLRANMPAIRLSTTLMPLTPSDESPKPRDYFVDGPIGVYQKVNAAGTSEKVILYSAMRRGGRLLYALDVTAPAEPRFLWKHTQATLPILGQTWSEPKVARVRGRSNPVIVMGAGYDSAAEDVSPPAATTMGNAVLVLDAFSGEVLKQFATARSVAADVALVDSDYDGYVDRAYAVDLGGNVYRVEFGSADDTRVEAWGSYKVASLAAGGTRKFFYPPDLVLTRSFTALLLASGDREKPLATTSSDAFFTVYDKRLDQGVPETEIAPIQASALGKVGTDQDKTAGCYISLDTNGEKAVNAPVTAAGITYFSTNMPTPPTPGMCVSNLGRAKVYSAPLFCQAPQSQVLTGGGLPPSPVAGVVTVTYTSQETGEVTSKEVPFIIGAPNTKASGIEGSKVTPAITPTRKRRYWYLENAR